MWDRGGIRTGAPGVRGRLERLGVDNHVGLYLVEIAGNVRMFIVLLLEFVNDRRERESNQIGVHLQPALIGLLVDTPVL